MPTDLVYDTNATSNQTVQIITYDAWGVPTASTGGVLQPLGFQPFGFAGGIQDPDTLLVRFGARDYNPRLGRWMTKDSERFDGGLNFYAYANNDPVNFKDTTGNGPWDAILEEAADEFEQGVAGTAAGAWLLDQLSEFAPSSTSPPVTNPAPAPASGVEPIVTDAPPISCSTGVIDTGVEERAREIVASGLAKDICGALEILYDSTPPGPQRNKIKATQKGFGCRRSSAQK